MSENRLDVALFRRSLAPSRERAREAIEAGMVLVNEKVATKAAQRVLDTDQLTVIGDPIGYVGRGGLKLERALDHFGLSVVDFVCLDVGASTGGFTDCLLRRGARMVYALDVGRDQLHADLRRDPRVIVMEQTDIRRVSSFPEPPECAVIDVSFISLTLVLPSAIRLLSPHAWTVALIKPQFELGPGRVGKKGVVRDPAHHREAVARVVEAVSGLGLKMDGVIPSPVPGTAGNQEFLALIMGKN